MEQVNEVQPQNQPPSQRLYALEQLDELADTITSASKGLQTYRAQAAGLLAGQRKAEAFGLYRLLKRQCTYLVEQTRATQPFLIELKNPLAPAAQKLAEQLAVFPLMTADYSRLTEVLKRFTDAFPDYQTINASIVGHLMNNVRLGHYSTGLTHAGYIADSIVLPAEDTANLIDPCCGAGDALLRLALGMDSQCYDIELDDYRAEQVQQQLYRVGFGSFLGSNISSGAFHAVFLNPPYLSVLSEDGGRSRDEERLLVKSIPLFMMGGLLTYAVPYYRLMADPCGIICDDFEQVRIHRFLDREFKQFKQVIVTGVRYRRAEAEQDAEALCSAAGHLGTLPTANLLPKACYELSVVSKKVETFRGAVFSGDELVRRLVNSTGLDRLFAKNRLDSEIRHSLLPLSTEQVGLIGGSGLVSGLMRCDYPHVAKGRITREKHIVTDENGGPHGHLISTEIRETISNRMIFSILTPSGFHLLT